MHVRVGYELLYDCPQPTPMILMLSIHHTHVSDTRRHSSAILSSPRKPARTIRIFSSAEYCLRVARRMALMTFSASSSF